MRGETNDGVVVVVGAHPVSMAQREHLRRLVGVPELTDAHVDFALTAAAGPEDQADGASGSVARFEIWT